MPTQDGPGGENIEMMDDSVRAANKTQYKVSKDQLMQLVEKYRQRKYIEDITYLQDELNGSQGLQEALDINVESGASTLSLQKREYVFGTNYKEPPVRTPFCRLLLAALDDFMLKILIVCAVFSIVVDMIFATPEQRAYAWIEGTAILFAVAVVSGVTAWSDYQKEGQFMKTQLMEENSKTVTVVRDHKETILHQNNIKVGDIIKIVNGMNIPIDGVVLQANGVMSDESAMTGESDHLPKETLEKCLQRQAEHEEGNTGKTNSHHDVPSPVLLSGTTIQTGQGWFVCIVVGDMTCEGQIMASLDEKPNEDTPLQQKLDVIAVDIGKLGMYAAILIVHVLLLRSFVEGMIRRDFDLFGGEKSVLTYYKQIKGADGKMTDNLNQIRPCNNAAGECDGQFGQYIKEWLHYVIVGVAIIVVAVPEGLPLAVMISLAYSVQKMLADQNFVKRLSSCEIMGGANNICSDKTGTLTKNQMTWTQIWVGGDYEVPNPDGEMDDKFQVEQFGITNETVMGLLAQAVSCNTIGTDQDAQATEMAMLKFINRCGVDFHHQRQKYLPKEMLRFQFDSARKRMSTVLELEDDEPTEFGYPKRIHVKGASEIVLGTCTHYLNSEGVKTVLDDQMQQQLDQIIKSYAKNALRTIAFAYKDLKESDGGNNHESKADNSKIYDIETGDFILVCIAGIKDIIRDEVPLAVQQCNEAGVRVRMITGDNKITAIAIAKECGIIYDGEEDEQCVCMEGPEFNEFVGGLKHKRTGEDIQIMGKEGSNEIIGNMKNMTIIRNKLKVLARSRPNDKYIMVKGLRDYGDIVAVTGDGTNDAPALKKADVGFAMKTGTQVAHNAADIIIQDDNFASIVKACRWGRNVYDNIRRFLQFQLSVNVVALITSFIGSCVLWESPLAAIQLLWVNLIMDSLASLALATETPNDGLLQRPPYRKREYIVSQKMIKHIMCQSLLQSVLLFVVVFGGPQFFPEGMEGPYNNALADYNNEVYRTSAGTGESAADYASYQQAYLVKSKPHFRQFGLTKQDIEAHPNQKVREWTGDFLISGMLKSLDGQLEYKPLYDITPSRHLTVVFNIFVWLQVFNMLAARKIADEINIFQGVFTNPMFCGVWTTIAIAQFCIVQFGSRAMKVHVAGITSQQWIICVVVGFVSLPVNLILKFVPDTIAFTMGDEDENDIRIAKEDYANLRKIAAETGKDLLARSMRASGKMSGSTIN